MSAKGADPEAAKAFVKWLWIDQEDSRWTSQSYGIHIPASRRWCPRPTRSPPVRGAEAAGSSTELGHAPDKLWTTAIAQAMGPR